MSACTQSDHATFDPGSSRGVTPPLLPTLVMAVLLGATSYFCHEPTTPAPAPVRAAVLASAVATAPETVAEAPFIPAPLAFQTQFPMIVAAQPEPVPPAQAHKAPLRPARIAAPRRAENPRMAARAPDKAPPALEKAPPAFEKAPPAFDGAVAPDKALPFAAEAAEPNAVAASDEGVLPEIALPFAPTIRAVTQAGAAAGAFVGARGAALGAETASLGAAVTGWVGRLR